MVVAGRLPDGDVGPVHAHEGDEVLRVVSGRVVVRCGDQQQVCETGEMVIVPPGVLHGFRVIEEAVLEVVAEYDIGTLYPVSGEDGRVGLIEVHRPDMPWGRPPGQGRAWTTDEEMRALLSRLAEPEV